MLEDVLRSLSQTVFCKGIWIGRVGNSHVASEVSAFVLSNVSDAHRKAKDVYMQPRDIIEPSRALPHAKTKPRHIELLVLIKQLQLGQS